MRPFSSLVAITLTSAVLLPVTQCNISNLNDEPGHPRPQRAESEIIQGDDNRSIAGPEAATPAVFDSCLIACYSDIALRFGEEFAKRLKSEGFIFETCPNDDEDVAEAVEGGEATVQRRAQLHHHEHDHDHVHHDHSHSHSHSHDHSPQQRALHRILGATNQLSRLWTSTSYSGPVRNTTTGLLQIPYAIKTTVPSDIFTPETYSTIQMALDHIEQQTGVLKFVPRENFEAEYIFFTYEDTAPYNNVCAANVGKQTNSKTTIYMGWCRQEKHLGSIIHEILHALGFWHEHSRPDRDAHITIHWDVVRSGAESAFEKALDVDSIGSPYDFKSIMHYPYNGFVDSTKGDATISPINALGPDVGMGQRVRLSENDVQQLRLLYQCSSGVRNANDVGITNLCSVDCKCWEYALGECSSDDECMGDLICGDTPSDYQEIRNANYRVDELPYYPYATGTFSCDVYCHTACCDAFRFPSAILKCPETCGSEPPVLTFETLPTKMCIQKDGSGPTTKTGSTVISSTTTTTTTTKSSVTTAATTVATTAATTTTTKATTTTTTTTSNNADWYMNWRIDSGRCVQDCIGSAPCIDRRRQSWEIPYPSVQSCCDTVKSWKPFDACAYLPVSPAPTNKPTPQPSRNPTKAPQPTNPPTSNPTSMPSRKPTPAPSHNPTPAPTSGPTQKPTPAPSAKPTPGPTSPPSQKPSPGPSAAPSHKPTPVPTHKPTPAPSSPPSHKPTPAPIAPTRKPTRMPTSVPTRQPTRRPTKQPTKNPTQKPVSSGNNGWYPDMVSNTNKCLNDGNPPSWLSYSYTSQSSCCTSHFNWAYNDCMGVEPQASNKWYVDWTRGKCVKECKTSEGGSCGGMAPGSWIVLHSTAEMCCAAHMSYVQPVSLCIYGG